MIETKDTDYHLQSMRSAHLVEVLGGKSADESHLFADAIAALLESGMTEEQIVQAYKAKYPQ